MEKMLDFASLFDFGWLFLLDYKSGIVMYLIEDYSHVKKHLKIDHIFSAKKYPIYYSYD